MTELQRQYVAFRDAGCTHAEAIHKLARRLDLDRSSIARTLASAERADAKRQAAHGVRTHGAPVAHPTAR